MVDELKTLPSPPLMTTHPFQAVHPYLSGLEREWWQVVREGGDPTSTILES